MNVLSCLGNNSWKDEGEGEFLENYEWKEGVDECSWKWMNIWHFLEKIMNNQMKGFF